MDKPGDIILLYNDAKETDPAKRFRPHMDLRCYCARHLRWFEARANALPKTFEEIEQYLNMTLYDVIAGLFHSLRNLSLFNHIFQLCQHTVRVGRSDVHHYLVGMSSEDPNIDPDLLPEVISQLLKAIFEETPLKKHNSM
jgi:hypothetical protein